MPVKIKLCPTLQQYVEGHDTDKGFVLENVAGKTVRQMARELFIPIEQMTCSIIINHYPSGHDRVIQEGGVVTAGNASGVNDAGAAAVLMSKRKAIEMGIKPLLKLLAVCCEGVDPKFMGLGPAFAIPKCLKQAKLQFGDVEYWEINEAFAAQFLGVGRALKENHGIQLDMERVNHNGSGIALGHPMGCTGLRIIVSLYHEMDRLGFSIGGASLCVGGGPAMASHWTRLV